MANSLDRIRNGSPLPAPVTHGVLRREGEMGRDGCLRRDPARINLVVRADGIAFKELRDQRRGGVRTSKTVPPAWHRLTSRSAPRGVGRRAPEPEQSAASIPISGDMAGQMLSLLPPQWGRRLRLVSVVGIPAEAR